MPTLGASLDAGHPSQLISVVALCVRRIEVASRLMAVAFRALLLHWRRGSHWASAMPNYQRHS